MCILIELIQLDLSFICSCCRRCCFIWLLFIKMRNGWGQFQFCSWNFWWSGIFFFLFWFLFRLYLLFLCYFRVIMIIYYYNFISWQRRWQWQRRHQWWRRRRQQQYRWQQQHWLIYNIYVATTNSGTHSAV